MLVASLPGGVLRTANAAAVVEVPYLAPMQEDVSDYMFKVPSVGKASLVVPVGDQLGMFSRTFSSHDVLDMRTFESYGPTCLVAMRDMTGTVSYQLVGAYEDGNFWYASDFLCPLSPVAEDDVRLHLHILVQSVMSESNLLERRSPLGLWFFDCLTGHRTSAMNFTSTLKGNR